MQFKQLASCHRVREGYVTPTSTLDSFKKRKTLEAGLK